MATAVLTATNIQQRVEADGRRSVEATIDFDTGDYVTNGLNLATVSAVVAGATSTGLLAALGLKVVEKAYVVASQHADNKYTRAEFVAAQDTKTISFFVDTVTNGTIDAPRLLMFVGDNEHTAAAIDGSAQVRLLLSGH